jgi:hypothetical protein
MRNRRESIRVGALVALLTVVGMAGGAWTESAAAQERLMLSRTPAAADVNAGLPGGKELLIAVGTLQFLGLIVFEAMAFMRRRSQPRMAAPLAWRVPVAFVTPATPQHGRQAA